MNKVIPTFQNFRSISLSSHEEVKNKFIDTFIYIERLDKYLIHIVCNPNLYLCDEHTITSIETKTIDNMPIRKLLLINDSIVISTHDTVNIGSIDYITSSKALAFHNNPKFPSKSFKTYNRPINTFISKRIKEARVYASIRTKESNYLVEMDEQLKATSFMELHLKDSVDDCVVTDLGFFDEKMIVTRESSSTKTLTTTIIKTNGETSNIHYDLNPMSVQKIDVNTEQVYITSLNDEYLAVHDHNNSIIYCMDKKTLGNPFLCVFDDRTRIHTFNTDRKLNSFYIHQEPLDI
jgi:hypothetical protein